LSYVSVRHRYLEKYSADAVREIARVAFKRGENLFTLEFSSASELQTAIEDLVKHGGLAKILQEQNKDFKSYTYSYNSRGCTLTFSFLTCFLSGTD